MPQDQQVRAGFAVGTGLGCITGADHLPLSGLSASGPAGATGDPPGTFVLNRVVNARVGGDAGVAGVPSGNGGGASTFLDDQDATEPLEDVEEEQDWSNDTGGENNSSHACEGMRRPPD